ncbi:MAG: transpeptidase family protein [Candidatus Azobacteroides sp.]|nr:transpeptidase family protein [Candidatus Azobacteroides sp.]
MEKKRIIIVFGIFVILLCTIMGFVVYRVSYFSVDKGKWAEYGEKRLHVVDTIPAERGNIYDCTGHLLSSTLPQYTFYLDFSNLASVRWRGASEVLENKDAAKKATMLDAYHFYLDSLAYYLSKEFKDKTPNQYKKHLNEGLKKKSGYYRITTQRASYQQMMRIKDFPFLRIGIREQNIDGYTAYKSNHSGLISVVEVKRKKPYGSLAFRTIGEIHLDRRMGGKNGLEYAYDSLLKGEPGLGRYVYATMNVPVGNREVNRLKSLKVTIKEPEAGKDIISTIDINMQEIAEKALRKKLMEHNAKNGMAAIMDVKTGEIRAVSNLMKTRSGMYEEGRNEMLVGLYEPGSTFKTAAMMAALEDGVVHVNDPALDGEGGVWNFQKGIKPIREHNWRRGGYQSLTVPQVLYNSSNIGISKIILKGYRSDPERFLNRLDEMGITRPMELEIPGSHIPQVNHPGTRHKRDENSMLGAWSATTLPWMSFGYELLLPPIYTLSYYNAIANNGSFLKPVFAQAVSKNGKILETFEPEELISSICSPGTLSAIQEMLLGVVEEGTGRPVKSDYMLIAGKTGTTQIPNTGQVNTSFCGYFPADNPRYSCFVMVCGIDSYLSAGKTAGEVFKNIAEQVYVANMKVPVKEAKDTLNPLIPYIKYGNTKETEMVLKRLDLMYTNAANTDWLKQVSSENSIQLDGIRFSQDVVPDVFGMGAKDAVYLLESYGLKVKLNGRGKVSAQSIKAGTAVRKGETITINLM